MSKKGFTLIELLLAMAIGGIVLAGASLSIYSILIPTARDNGQVTALADVSGAAFAIKKDLLMAQSSNLTEGVPASSVNLTWFDFTSSFGTGFMTDHFASYKLFGRTLTRNYDGANQTVGRNVVALNFTQSTQVIQGASVKFVTVVVSSGNTTLAPGIETLTFTVHLRTEEIN